MTATGPTPEIGERGVIAAAVMWLRRLRDPRRAVWVLPVVLAALLVVLVALGISGTSTPRLTPDGASDSSVIIGTPRAVRSDQWMVRTPLVLGQVARGFPTVAAVGVGDHDMAVISDLPTATWSEVFRPHQIGYFLLPVDQGTAFEWWFPVVVLVLGVYALVLVLVRDWRWAAIAGLVMFASPYFHWWFIASMMSMVGWGCGAVAAYLASLDEDRPRRRWALLGIAAYASCCFALVLYPPAQIPMLYVVAAVVVAVVAIRLRERSVGWRRVLVGLAVIGGTTLVVSVAFLLAHRGAFSAIANTVYPGDRRDAGGAGSTSMLFTSWFGTQYATNDVGMRGVLFANESEASSFLFLGALLIPALPFVWRDIAAAGRRTVALIAALIGVIGLLWIYFAVGLPMVVARLLLLDRSTPPRVIPALGLAAVLLMVVVGVALRERVGPTWTRLAAGAVVVALGAWFVASLGFDLRGAGAPVTRIGIAAAVVMVVGVGATWFWRPLLSGSMLVVIGLVMVLGVHPLVRGVGHVTESELARTVRMLDDSSSGWLADTWGASSILTAVGVDNLSGVNLYPNADAWRVLDPTGRQEAIWNRYSITMWELDPSAIEPVISLVQDDVVSVRIDPCGRHLADLGIDRLVTEGRPEIACMDPEIVVRGPSGAEVTIWRRRGVGAG